MSAEESNNAAAAAGEKEATQISLGGSLTQSQGTSNAEVAPKVVGIKAFSKSTNAQPEIMSPMKRKQGALQKLKMQDSESEEDEKSNKFEVLEPLFKDVLSNFESRKA